MRNLEIINSEIASLEAQLSTAKSALQIVEENYGALIKETWIAQLDTILDEGDIVDNTYHESISVKRNQVRTERNGKKYDYSQEIFSIYRPSYGSSEDVPFQLSTYSTAVDNDFEFDRLITVGKVAAFMKENSKNLIDTFRISLPSQSAEQKEVYRLQREIGLLQNEKSKLEDHMRLTTLETVGIEFTPDEYNDYPSLEVRWDWEVRGIFKIKVIRKTASGKSADVEITSRFKKWEGGFDECVQTVDKVRMDKIGSLLYHYRNAIVA